MKLTRAQAAKIGIVLPPEPKAPAPTPGSHAGVAKSYDDTTLEGIYQDLKKRNLRDYSNHETRWGAERLSAVAAERRVRKAAGNYNPKLAAAA